MLTRLKHTLAATTLAVAAGGVGSADAAEYTLRIQTHFPAESTPGKVAAQFLDDVTVMSGGRALVQNLYDQYNMHIVGYWLQGHESLSSTRSLASFESLKDWKFRSPPGLETEIFASFGAKPIVMDFGEVPTALRTGIVDGADASTLNTNAALGLFDIATHVTYPGFHSMPTETLACNKAAWDKLSAGIQRMMEVALARAALNLAILTEIKDKKVAREIAAKGVTVHDWSVEDRKQFRTFARERWQA